MMNIMYEYMADIDLPVPFTNEFMLLIPEQRAMVNRLFNEGILSGYAVSIESAKLWMTVFAQDEISVINLINSFPIAPYITYKISRLAFHNNAGFKLPSFSLN